MNPNNFAVVSADGVEWIEMKMKGLEGVIWRPIDIKFDEEDPGRVAVGELSRKEASMLLEDLVRELNE